VAVIGGSFAPLGGQNLIEAPPAAPRWWSGRACSFAEATRLALEAGAAIQAADAPSAVKQALELIRDDRRRRRMADAGRKLCLAHRGATERHLALIAQVTAPARG
jgi:3-deoxy-D-manno-octulosonic-acid transferase